jgi:hypothetical protein
MELRRELRYRLEVPALFTWQSAHHKHLRGEGTTRDISALGAFIVTSTCPPPETQVQVEVGLPSLTVRKSGIRIKGEARVIRVEHPAGSDGENGFAVVREDMDQWSLAMPQDDSDFIPAVDATIAAKTNCE